MIVQACLNGARAADFHPGLPLTADEMAKDAALCVAAGAGELHIHARGSDRRESLSAVASTIAAVRVSCPGTLVGVSTGAWIEQDTARTLDCIAKWETVPDYASVNLSEPDAPSVIALLRGRGIGVEAGLASVADAIRFVGIGESDRFLRILIEIDEQELPLAQDIADAIAQVLREAGVRRQILLHGSNATVWPLARRARQRRWSTRVGLEDGQHLPDGEIAPDNAALVAAAVAIFREDTITMAAAQAAPRRPPI